MYKQLIIARKDLNMSPGKFPMLLLLFFQRKYFGEAKKQLGKEMVLCECKLYHNWIIEAETKVVCRAKNKNDLLRAVEAAKELGMEEYKDYFLIYDACRTELEKESPEGTLTCIGFRPMEAEEIGRKYQLYH